MNTESQQTEIAMSNNAASVNFYILSDSDLQHRLQFVFRLVEKAQEQQLCTLIITADSEQLVVLDKLLWTAKPERFIAHEMITEKVTLPLPKVLLTEHLNQLSTVDFSPQVVIDLSYDATPLNFPKVMLVANQHPQVLPNARMKYQAYINHGVKPTVHKIGHNTASESH